jgi:plastocyanin
MKYCIQRLLAALLFFTSAAASRADEKIIVTTNQQTWKEAETAVKPGDVVIWKIEKGKHGVMFNNFAEAEKVLKIETGGLEIKEQPGHPAPAKGTEAKQGPNTILVKATIKEIPAGVTEVPFYCTAHGQMKGKLVFKNEEKKPIPKEKRK